MTAGDDRSLLLAWRKGDNRAGLVLVERHHPAIRRTFLNKVSRAAEAEALAERTFAAAREGRVPLSNGDDVDTWLFAVARHVLLEWRDEVAGRRRSAPTPEVSVAGLGLGRSPAPAPSEDARRLLEALRALPLESQLAVELAAVEDLPPRRLARVLGCLEAAAHEQLRTAQAALCEALGGASPRAVDAWAAELRRAWAAG